MVCLAGALAADSENLVGEALTAMLSAVVAGRQYLKSAKYCVSLLKKTSIHCAKRRAIGVSLLAGLLLFTFFCTSSCSWPFMEPTWVSVCDILKIV